MRLDITGRHVTVTPALRLLVEKRLAAFERLLNSAALSALVIVSKEKYRHKVEMTIHTRGDHTLNGTAEGTSWPMAIRQASLKIEQQAKKLKGKWAARKREAARAVRSRKVTPAPGDSAPVSDGPSIIRATRYAVKPMSLDDAATRINAADETFLVFRNAADDSVSVMYRRKDGNLGLIQP